LYLLIYINDYISLSAECQVKPFIPQLSQGDFPACKLKHEKMIYSDITSIKNKKNGVCDRAGSLNNFVRKIFGLILSRFKYGKSYLI
ncbi:MAG: hypothetical protein KKG62_06070, partial [Actinobacteria bacterium]|nr:hypothetical protein [Actinomycetota bacterium]